MPRLRPLPGSPSPQAAPGPQTSRAGQRFLLPWVGEGGWRRESRFSVPQATALQVRLWLLSVSPGGLGEDRAPAGCQAVAVPSGRRQREGTFLCCLPWEPG